MHRWWPFAILVFAVPIERVVTPARAHAPAAEAETREAPAALAVRAELPPPPAGVVEMRFRDLVKLPVGPRGLEPGEILKANLGKRVRMVGFMVRQAEAVPGRFLLAPVPVEIGNADEGLADDVPAALVEVELPDPFATLPWMPGLLQIGGTLEAGGSGITGNPRIAYARIRPDERTVRALQRAGSHGAPR